jgi:hypothetical protein
MADKDLRPDSWSVDNIDWTTVPWYRKPLTLAAIAALLPPVALIIIWAGPTFRLSLQHKRILMSDRYRIFATVALCGIMFFWMLMGVDQ